MANQERKLVNLGCGQVRPEGWLNYDSSLNSLLQSLPRIGKLASVVLPSVKYEKVARYLDLRGRWPFEDGSVDVIYASHVFEHLSRKVAQRFIRKSFDKLKRGGVIRIVVPDLAALAQVYITNLSAGKMEATEEFLYAINLHKENTYKNETLLGWLIHSWQGYPHQHKYMYDAITLGRVLREGGFVGIQTSCYGISTYIKNIRDVECTDEGVVSLYLEAVKP